MTTSQSSQARVHAKDQTLTLFEGSDSPVLSIDTCMGERLQVVPTSESVCWSPCGVIYVFHVRQRGRAPRLPPVWIGEWRRNTHGPSVQGGKGYVGGQCSRASKHRREHAC